LNLYTWMIGKLMSSKILTLYFICAATIGSLVLADEKKYTHWSYGWRLFD